MQSLKKVTQTENGKITYSQSVRKGKGRGQQNYGRERHHDPMMENITLRSLTMVEKDTDSLREHEGEYNRRLATS